MSSTCRLRLLGPVEVEQDNKPGNGFISRKAAACLGYLVLQKQPIPRSYLAHLFWGDKPERRGRANLSVVLNNLTKLTPGCLQADRQTVQFDRANGLWLDIDAFETFSLQDHPAALAQAVKLYRDELMTGLFLDDSPDFETWLTAERERWRQRAVHVCRQLVAHHLERGAYRPGLTYASRLLEIDPWLEEAHRQKMVALAHLGQRTAALAQYEACRQILLEELGVDPEAETTTLYQHIRDGLLDTPHPQPGPVREAQHPPLPPHNLPAQSTPLIGREEELTEVNTLLADPGCRLLTLVGPGGIGKTRLAQEAAGLHLPHFADGVYFVSLARLEASDSIVPTIADTLNFSFHDDGPPQQQLLDYLRSKTMLLLLDNFEHLLGGATLVTDILQAAPRVKILATSRDRLSLQVEHPLQLTGIDIPTDDSEAAITHSGAVRLFIESARRMRPGFEQNPGDWQPVAHICRLVQGMPLALILTASWIDMLSPTEIAAELDRSLKFLETDWPDVPDRHQSMRAVFNQSWRLLSVPERELFQKLSVFRGGFTRQAAQEVAGASLKTLRGLLNKSLLQLTPDRRYQIHELMRQFGAEKLAAETPAEVAAVRDRHSAHYCRELHQLEAPLKGSQQLEAIASIENDFENMRAAWAWAAQHQQTEQLAQAAESLGIFCEWRGRYQEGEVTFRLAAETLAAGMSASEKKLRVMVLVWQGIFAMHLGHTDKREQLLQQSMAILDDPALAGEDTRAARAFTFRTMSQVSDSRNESICQLEQSLELYRSLEDRWRVAEVLQFLAEVTLSAGDLERARQVAEESLTLRRILKDKRGTGAALMQLAVVIRDQGELEESSRIFQESLALFRELEYWPAVAQNLFHVGVSLEWLGKFAEARLPLEEGLQLYDDLGVRSKAAELAQELGHVEVLDGEYQQARRRIEQQAQPVLRELGPDLWLGISLADLGMVALAEKSYPKAHRLLTESVEILRRVGFQFGLCEALTHLAHAERILGNSQQSRQCLIEVLAEVIEAGTDLPLWEGLPAIVLLLADGGEPEQAVELYALATRHPFIGKSAWFEEMAGQHIADIAAALPPEVVEAAQARGRALDLWETAAALLETLPELKWDSDSESATSLVGSKKRSTPHNLASQPTPLIGRADSLAEITARLADPDCRLLTILGPGGVGKTRLSIDVARQALAHFPDGVYFISLASTDSAEDVIPRIASTIDPDTYLPNRAAPDFVAELRRRDPALLLVLDNLEQLLPDATATIETLLSQTRRLKLLVTSRQAVNIRWEWRYALNGLAYPSNGAASNPDGYSAVEMFLQRLKQVRQGPLAEEETQALVRICRLVGGMPLGIELAATQAGRLSCGAIADALAHNLDALVASLQDLPPRQRSLRASFEVTWANLSTEEQAVFRCLSLFRSSFTLEAAQAVAQTGLSLLVNLMDKSLLRQVSPERYNLHEVLRQFAQEKLAEEPAEQAETIARYRRYYTTFLHQRIEALQQEKNLAETIAEVYSEIDNLWAGWVQVTGEDDAQEFASTLTEALHTMRCAQVILVPNTLRIIEHQQQLLESQSSGTDVCLVDVAWVDTLAGHLLDVSEGFRGESQNHFSLYIEHSVIDGQLVALPYSANVGVLYYRADLLAKYGFIAPPTTWDELELMAAEIQAGERAEGHADFWGFIWQGRDSESLTCNALEWQASHGGGQIIEPERVISVNNPGAIAAFERAARWVGTISPVSVTEAGMGQELATQRVWATGGVAFMRTWTDYFFELIQNPRAKERVGLILLPNGGAGRVGTLGGQQIAISKYARHPKGAIELVRYAVSPKAQLQRAVSPPYWPPTLSDLYDHQSIGANHPHLRRIKEALSSNVVARPSKICGPLYPQVSKAYSAAVHSILTGQAEAATALVELEAKLVEITGFKVVPPDRQV